MSMDTLSPELYKKIRNILLRCQEFQSDENLRSIFIVGKLSIYHKKIPEAQSIDTRVDQCIAFLSQEDWEDDSALASFLEALRNRYPEERHYRDLDDVAREVRKVAEELESKRKTNHSFGNEALASLSSSWNVPFRRNPFFTW